MARHLQIAGHPTGFAGTIRTDTWWSGPLTVLVVLSSFAAYVTWAAFQGRHYYAAPYLSPLYSPVLFTNPTAPGAVPTAHAWFGQFPSFWPSLLPASPALLILIFPGAFRFTCYYYRKAYYRAFAGSPPGCAVNPLAEGRRYRGETGLLLFQNLHRIAMYFALVFVVILFYDAVHAFFLNGRFGIGVGSLVLLINATLLGGYTFGCHSLRHVIGGHDDCMSCGRNTLKHKSWKAASWFNARHMYWAWLSLFWVAFTDVYVRLVSSGAIRDLNTW
jgi:hypothetical protein